MLIKINQNKTFIVFRSEDVSAIQPVLSTTCNVKYYLLSLVFTDKKISLSIEEADNLAKLLKPFDLSGQDAELNEQQETIDTLLESINQ